MQYAVGIQSASGLLACDSPSTFKYPFRGPREAGVASGPPATAAFTPAYGFLEGPRPEIVTATFNPAPPSACSALDKLLPPRKLKQSATLPQKFRRASRLAQCDPAVVGWHFFMKEYLETRAAQASSGAPQ